jgi:hypothetical protein
MKRDELQKSVNDEYLPLVGAQFPGLLDRLVDPLVQVMSVELNDVEMAIDSLERCWKEQGSTDPREEWERAGEVFDELRGRSGIPLPAGAMLLIITHGQVDNRKLICVPVRTDN